MEKAIERNAKQRQRRAMRVRSKLRGSSERPRLSVRKSNAHIQVQLIDDEKGITLGAVSTFGKKNRGTEFGRRSQSAGQRLGEEIAKIAKKKKIERVIFDRGASKYHGVVAALAAAARTGGLQF